MEQYIIKGGNPLVGEVEIAGAKNAAVSYTHLVNLSRNYKKVQQKSQKRMNRLKIRSEKWQLPEMS